MWSPTRLSSAEALLLRPLLNPEDLAAWARKRGFGDLVPSVWHLSIIRHAGGPRPAICTQTVTLRSSRRRRISAMGGVIALEVPNERLASRQKQVLQSAGCYWPFRTYLPHISFTPDDRRVLTEIEPFQGRLVLGPETWDKA